MTELPISETLEPEKLAEALKLAAAIARRHADGYFYLPSAVLAARALLSLQSKLTALEAESDAAQTEYDELEESYEDEVKARQAAEAERDALIKDLHDAWYVNREKEGQLVALTMDYGELRQRCEDLESAELRKRNCQKPADERSSSP